ncbi:MAG: type II secretion system inner membrane protein GspF [Acidiferrobacterales bacterium]
MAAFEYQALDLRGRTVKGVIEGDAERQVRSALRDKGLMPLRVDAIAAETSTAGESQLRLVRGLSSAGLALLTRQFATLVHAGLTIEECLNTLIEQTEATRARKVLAGVRGSVLEGQSLASSLGAFPQAFPNIYRHMVDAGEQSGKLDEVLERLADHTENRQALRQEIILAFIYPALVTVVAIVIVGFLLVTVVPQVTRVFENTGQTLPTVTRALITISDFLRAGGMWWGVVLVALIILIRLALRNTAVRRRWHRFLLRAPLLGRLLRGINAARFANTLGILTASGIPLLQAMQSAVMVVTNLPMRSAVEEALRQVREGGSLAQALDRAKLFPPLVIHLIASGEASGNLDIMLARAAQAQTRELETWLKTLTTLLGPLMILVVGAMVGFIVLAMLLPIFEMNQLVR